MTTTRPAIAQQAVKHLGEPTPDNTCVRLGLRLWPHELGIPVLETDSTGEAQRMAEQHVHGWTYHTGTSGLQVGDFVDWSPKALGDPNDRHVSCVVEFNDAGDVKTVGAGGPTGKVAYQPRNGGFNPRDYFQGYFRAPLSAAPESKPAPSSSSSSGKKTYTVKHGDVLGAIARAHGVSLGAILQANPPDPKRPRTGDYSIVNANLILVGQKLHLP